MQQPRVFEHQFRLFVGNLPWQVDNARLEQVFSEHGKVLEARVVYDRDTGRSRGFGFVIMSSQTELDDAIAALDGQVSFTALLVLGVKLKAIRNMVCILLILLFMRSWFKHIPNLSCNIKQKDPTYGLCFRLC